VPNRRQPILDALEQRLLTVQPANGYLSKFVAVDYWGNTTEYDQDWLCYRDPDEDYKEVNRQQENSLKVEIEASVFGNEAPAKANQALKEILSALYSDRQLGGLAHNLQFIRSSKICETGGKKACSLQLDIEIIYRTEAPRTDTDAALWVGQEFLLPGLLSVSPFWRDILGDPDASNLEIPASGIEPYIHEQTTPSIEWLVNHNLHRKPGVQVRNPAGNVVMANPYHISADQLVVFFTVETTGTVYCL
jgi:hypothetical protein